MIEEKSISSDSQREDILTNPEIHVSKFDDLTPRQVANLYALRYNVFVKEQKSIYDEHDGRDFDALHIFIEDTNRVIAYARAYQSSSKEAVFGRVAVDQAYRGQDLGKKIVAKAIESIKELPGVTKIQIEAQEYLAKFYESFGFLQTSEPFDDDGVMHVAMEMSL